MLPAAARSAFLSGYTPPDPFWTMSRKGPVFKNMLPAAARSTFLSGYTPMDPSWTMSRKGPVFKKHASRCSEKHIFEWLHAPGPSKTPPGPFPDDVQKGFGF